jgi:hypothetical protein
MSSNISLPGACFQHSVFLWRCDGASQRHCGAGNVVNIRNTVRCNLNINYVFCIIPFVVYLTMLFQLQTLCSCRVTGWLLSCKVRRILQPNHLPYWTGQYLLVDSEADLQGRHWYSKQTFLIVFTGFLHSSILGHLPSLCCTWKTVVGLQTAEKRNYICRALEGILLHLRIYWNYRLFQTRRITSAILFHRPNAAKQIMCIYVTFICLFIVVETVVIPKVFYSWMYSHCSVPVKFKNISGDCLVKFI